MGETGSDNLIFRPPAPHRVMQLFINGASSHVIEVAEDATVQTVASFVQNEMGESC